MINWTLGMDNARFTKEVPGRVPPTLVMSKSPPGEIGIAWSAPDVAPRNPLTCPVY